MAQHDFNGDGRSDILWREDSGLMTNWLGSNTGAFTDNLDKFLRAVDTDWVVVATGDFNGDGYSDLLWRNTDGRITDWLGTASGGFLDNLSSLLRPVGGGWNVAGSGDFNGDGRDDILWRNSDGRVTNWLGTPSGNFSDNIQNLSRSSGTDWHIVGIGDFNGDNRDDVLWQNDAGYITNWLGTGSGDLVSNDDNAYTRMRVTVSATGDFDGDGRDDIIIADDWSFYSAYFAREDGSFAFDDYQPFADASSRTIAGTGDYNGDGTDDILWRLGNGTLTEWLGQSDGRFESNEENVWRDVSTSWHVIPPDPVSSPWDY